MAAPEEIPRSRLEAKCVPLRKDSGLIRLSRPLVIRKGSIAASLRLNMLQRPFGE